MNLNERSEKPGDNGLGHDGLSHEEIFSHSWMPALDRWLWISKQSAVEDFGYPATRAQIRKLGYAASRVRRIGPSLLLQKSYA